MKEFPDEFLGDLPALVAASSDEVQALALILCKHLGRSIAGPSICDALENGQGDAQDNGQDDAHLSTIEYFQDPCGVQFLGLMAYITAERTTEDAAGHLLQILQAQEWHGQDGKQIDLPTQPHLKALLDVVLPKFNPTVKPSEGEWTVTSKVEQISQGQRIHFSLLWEGLSITGDGTVEEFTVKEHNSHGKILE